MVRKAKVKAKPTRTAAKRTGAKKSAGTKPATPKTIPHTIPHTVSPKQQFLDTFARETATTLKVLRAYPATQSEFRPHMRAKSARELAFTFIIEQSLLTRALTDQLIFSGSGGPPPVPNDFQTIVQQFEKDHAALMDLIRGTPEDSFHTTLQFPTGPGQMGDWSKLAFAWFILSDQIHHRGQYSVYLRMAGGKVPSIYGPSADEPWR
jgi:hypothetical protein